MFATIGHTFELMRMSWGVLMKDRELILFPVFAGITLAITALLFAGIASGTGTLDRVDAITGQTSEGEQAQVIDAVLGLLFYASASFIVIFFNAALVSAALERLRGGDPSVRSGLAAASKHLPAILGWALISATVGLLLQALRNNTDNIIGRIAISLVGGVWAYMTFFVIPVLVAEGIGPIGAIKRSGGLFRETWGRQAVSSFGFGLVYLLAALIAFLPAAALFAVSPVLAFLVGVPLVALALGAVQALEGIFKAALYEFAMGERPLDFDTNTLSGAYRAM